MNKSLVTTPLVKLVEALLLEYKILEFVLSSLIWKIRNKVFWTITIVTLSSSKGFALEVSSFGSHGAHILLDQKGQVFFKVICRARDIIFILTIFFHFFHLHNLGGGSYLLCLQSK